MTAHTLDDQIETVFMRILRDAGPRGLAGLYAESEIVRPFLDIEPRDARAHMPRPPRAVRAGSVQLRSQAPSATGSGSTFFHRS